MQEVSGEYMDVREASSEYLGVGGEHMVSGVAVG